MDAAAVQPGIDLRMDACQQTNQWEEIGSSGVNDWLPWQLQVVMISKCLSSSTALTWRQEIQYYLPELTVCIISERWGLLLNLEGPVCKSVIRLYLFAVLYSFLVLLLTICIYIYPLSFLKHLMVRFDYQFPCYFNFLPRVEAEIVKST